MSKFAIMEQGEHTALLIRDGYKDTWGAWHTSDGAWKAVLLWEEGTGRDEIWLQARNVLMTYARRASVNMGDTDEAVQELMGVNTFEVSSLAGDVISTPGAPQCFDDGTEFAYVKINLAVRVDE